jgi:hypothetical protein
MVRLRLAGIRRRIGTVGNVNCLPSGLLSCANGKFNPASFLVSPEPKALVSWSALVPMVFVGYCSVVMDEVSAVWGNAATATDKSTGGLVLSGEHVSHSQQ